MEQHVKERLVGAIVLVAAAVVVIPMILSGEDPQPHRSEATSDRARRESLPSAPAAPATRSPPSTLEPPRAQAPKVDAVPALNDNVRSPPAPAPKAVPPPQRAVPAAAPKAADKPAPKGPGAPTEGWVVQLGSFSNHLNAQALRDRLQKKGYQAFVESGSSVGSKVTRVYVGPHPRRETSQAELEALYKETGLKGLILRRGS